MTSGRLALAAKCRAVSPVDVTASGFAPCWMREETTFVCPIKDAMWSGVRPTWNTILNNKIKVKILLKYYKNSNIIYFGIYFGRCGGIHTIVITNSRFLQRPPKRSHGNQLIHRHFSKAKSIGSRPRSRESGRQADGLMAMVDGVES